jgi:hypothetical protein
MKMNWRDVLKRRSEDFIKEKSHEVFNAKWLDENYEALKFAILRTLFIKGKISKEEAEGGLCICRGHIYSDYKIGYDNPILYVFKEDGRGLVREDSNVIKRISELLDLPIRRGKEDFWFGFRIWAPIVFEDVADFARKVLPKLDPLFLSSKLKEDLELATLSVEEIFKEKSAPKSWTQRIFSFGSINEK